MPTTFREAPRAGRPRTRSASLLRAGVGARLAGAVALSGLLWALILGWALA